MSGIQYRLLPCENFGVALPSGDLVSTIARHYWTQSLQQFYASVLGMNVLTNPHGLITDRGITEGTWKVRISE
jgi:hypothetical protein